jgi:hypothetical protein
MQNENEYLTYLYEAMEERVKGLSEQANHEPEFIKINQATVDFMATVTDEDTRSILLQYEALKSDYTALIMTYLYKAGAKDVLRLYGLLQKQIYTD